ncbi:hypothetical protein [Rhizobium leguminosarum]
MYQAFDSFLNVETWFTSNPNDERRFYLCLQGVVRDEDFNPDAMGDYIRRKVGVTSRDGSHPFEMTINNLVRQAWAVRDYLQYTRE